MAETIPFQFKSSTMLESRILLVKFHLEDVEVFVWLNGENDSTIALNCLGLFLKSFKKHCELKWIACRAKFYINFLSH